MTQEEVPQPQQDLKRDDLVRISNLRNATYLNDKIGRIVTLPKDDGGGRVGVQFVDIPDPKSIKVDNLELMDKERHFHFVKKDIPGLCFLDPEDSNIRIQMRIENGHGKNCIQCDKDLENQYHVRYKGQWLCEEDYVRKYCGEDSPIFRICALCQEYIPLSEAKGLPGGLFDMKYPNGKLPSGIQIGFPTDEPDYDYIFFAHRTCFVCHLCESPMYIPELHPHGFLFLNEPEEAKFLCQGPPGSTSFCNERYHEVVKARERLNEIKSLPVEELKQLLIQREVQFTDEEDTKSLVNKVVVTDTKKGRRVATIVTSREEVKKDLNTPGAFAENCCTAENCGGCDKNFVTDEKLISSRAQPGTDLVDKRCKHGCPEYWKCWDDRQRDKKRTAFGKYTRSSEFRIFFMSEEQCRENIPDWDGLMDPATGRQITPFVGACQTFCNYWYFEERETLLLDIEEQFIPRLMWNIAVSSACEEDGGHDYAAAVVAASLIIAEMMKLLANNQLPVDGVAGYESNSDAADVVMRTMMNMIRKGTLCQQLQQIEAGPESLYQLMNSPELRRCDCMQYVATAASIGRLRLKDSKVKNVKHHCAVCNESLAQPKFCSLCFEVPYCDRRHQRDHWKVHKKVCKGRKKGGK